MTITPPRPVWPRVTHLAGLVVGGRCKHHCGIVLDRTSRRHLRLRKKTDCGGQMVKIVTFVCLQCRVQADRQQCWLGVWWDEVRMFVLCCGVCTREHKVVNTESLKRKVKKSALRGVPKRSHIQVLTTLDVAWVQWSDENRSFQRDMNTADRAWSKRFCIVSRHYKRKTRKLIFSVEMRAIWKKKVVKTGNI